MPFVKSGAARGRILFGGGAANDASGAIRRQRRGGYQVFLLKSCPRCGGDVDATDTTDVRCVQCGHRPPVGALVGERLPGRGFLPLTGLELLCPRCDSDFIIALEKLRERDNIVYRCRMCGHIYSPRLTEADSALAS